MVLYEVWNWCFNLNIFRLGGFKLGGFKFQVQKVQRDAA